MSIAGLSPRVRGSLNVGVDGRAIEGSIPASAGEPRRSTSITSVARVYPRECGGARRRRRSHWRIPGLSPRVRGSHRKSYALHRKIGSIPASAGEPTGGPCLDI